MLDQQCWKEGEFVQTELPITARRPDPRKLTFHVHVHMELKNTKINLAKTIVSKIAVILFFRTPF